MMIYYRSSDKFSFISKVTDGTAVIQEDEVSTVSSTSVASNEVDGEQLLLFSSNIESLPLPSELSCTGLEEGSIPEVDKMRQRTKCVNGKKKTGN